MQKKDDLKARPASDAYKNGRRLRFTFTGGERPELDEVEFCLCTGATSKKLTRTGPTESFRWNQFARAFSLFFIHYLLWAKRHGTEKFIFHGELRRNAVATLGDGIEQPHNKFHALFEQGLKALFFGLNLNGKGKGDRQIWILRPELLPSDCVEIKWTNLNHTAHADEACLQRLAKRIHAQTRWPPLAFASSEMVPPAAPPQLSPGSRDIETLQAAPEKPPVNLQAPSGMFFEHDALHELRKDTKKRLAYPGLLVLHKRSASGKTTFARQVVYDLVNDKIPPGGAVWVDCDTNNTFELCMARLTELLLREKDVRNLSAKEKAQKLGDYFNEKHNTLVVLDSFECVSQPSPLISWLHANRARACFLITTIELRDGLREPDEAEHIRLLDLDRDAALRLFKHHAQRSSFSPEETEVVHRLCEAVGYSPEEIRMLARHVRPGGIELQKLRNQFDLDPRKVLETGGESRECHASIQACFDFSIRHTSQEDIYLLYLLSIPHCGLHKALAARLLTHPEIAPKQGTLARCFDQALIEEKGDRYTLHATWRTLLHREMGSTTIVKWEEAFVRFMVEEAERQKRTRPEHQQDFEAAFWLCERREKWELLSRICRRIRELPKFEFEHYARAYAIPEDELQVWQYELEGEIDYSFIILKSIATSDVDNAKDRLCIFLAIARNLTDLTCRDGDHESWKNDFRHKDDEARWTRVLELSREVEDKEAEIEARHVLAHYHLYKANWAEAEIQLRAILDLCECNDEAESAQTESARIHLAEALRQQQKKTDEVENLEILGGAWEKRENHLPLPWPDDQWFSDPLFDPSRSSPKRAADLFLRFANTLVTLRELEEAHRWLVMVLKVADDSAKRYAALTTEEKLDIIRHKDDLGSWIRNVWKYWPWTWNLHAKHLRALSENKKALWGYEYIIKGAHHVRYYCRSLEPLAEAFVGAAEITAAGGDLKPALKLALQAQAVQRWIDDETEWKEEPGMSTEQSLAVLRHNGEVLVRGGLFIPGKDDKKIRAHERAERRKLQRILDAKKEFLDSELSLELPPVAPGQPDNALREEIRSVVKKLKEQCAKKAHRGKLTKTQPRN